MSALRPGSAAALGPGVDASFPPRPLAGEGWGERSPWDGVSRLPSPAALCASASPASGGGEGAAGGGDLDGVASAASMIATTSPSDTVPSTLTRISFTTPATLDGTSIV